MSSNKFRTYCGVILTVIIIISMIFTVYNIDAADTDRGISLTSHYMSLDGTTEISNSRFNLILNNNNLSFILKDLVFGKEFYSGKRANDGNDGLNDQNGEIFTDGIVVSYLNTSGVEVRFGFTNSRLNPSGVNPVDSISVTGSSITIDVNLRNIPVKFRLIITLSDDNMEISIPNKYIEDNNNKLLYISPYPALESRFDLNNGYMFIPDGSGAIIDMSIPCVASQPYSQRVYGQDYGLLGIDAALRSADVSPVADIGFPVYAIADNINQTGVVTVIDSGAEYAEINAIAAGSDNNRYNSMHTKFFYRDKYKKYLDKKGTFKNSFTQDIYNYNAKLRFYFLSDDINIASVAKIYRDYLVSKYNLISKITDTTDIGLRLQYLMAENRPTMFGNSDVVMTSVQNIVDYTNIFNMLGITNQQVSLSGYQSGGLSNSNHSSFNYSGSINNNTLASLNNLLKTNNSSLSFAYNYSMIDSVSRGYSNKDIAMTISNNTITTFNPFTYLQTKDIAALTLLTNSKSLNKMNLDKTNLSRIGNNLSLDIIDVSKFLSSSYLTYNVNRSEAVKDNQKLLRDANFNYNLTNPYEYMVQFASNIIDSYQSNSNLLIESESVPFVSMVMSGLINMYSAPINLNFNSKTDILRMIDYNIYPSYLLTSLSSIELLMTKSNYIISSQYSLWKDNIISTYNEINSALRKVIGCNVISRNKLTKDVYETVYSNGIRIVVNYSKTQYNYNGQIIDGLSYKVEKNG